MYVNIYDLSNFVFLHVRVCYRPIVFTFVLIQSENDHVFKPLSGFYEVPSARLQLTCLAFASAMMLLKGVNKLSIVICVPVQNEQMINV